MGRNTFIEWQFRSKKPTTGPAERTIFKQEPNDMVTEAVTLHITLQVSMNDADIEDTVDTKMK